MESWGLIACDMQVVLRLTEANKHIIQRAAAHQWWGNSVTMGDWSKLWFKEAFATWLAHLCRSKCWEDFREALFQDSSCDSYPLETSKWHLMPLERQSPMYAKAYGVVCMISNYIGSPLLLECLGQFLKTDANRNAQASDLWKVLEAASGKQVGRFVKIWVENTGRPLITVTGLEGNSIRIRQEPFLQSEGDPVLYPIPLGFCSSTSNGEEEVLWEREKTFDVLNVDIFKLNRDYLGVYYTVYTPGILQKLGEAVKDGKLSIEDRAGLLLEVRGLAKAGIYKTSTVLRLMELFKEEEELLVWVSIFEVLRSITEAWMREEQIIKTHLNLFKLDLVRDMAHKIGWEFKEGEEDHQQQLKKLLFKNAGLAGDEEVITAASNMFQEYVAGDNSAIAPKILGSVFLIVLEHGRSNEVCRSSALINSLISLERNTP
jgi:aminopeptidase 2